MATVSDSASARSAPRIQIKTAKVAGRRELHFTSMQEMLDDAERLCSARQVSVLGNWQLGRAIEHLARTVDMSLDGAQFKAPWYVRMIGPLFKKQLLSRPMRPGFKLPANAAKFLIPEHECAVESSIAHLRSVVARAHRTDERQPSPVFGRLTRDEWDQLHLRHAELHLSFFVPG